MKVGNVGADIIVEQTSLVMLEFFNNNGTWEQVDEDIDGENMVIIVICFLSNDGKGVPIEKYSNSTC